MADSTVLAASNSTLADRLRAARRDYGFSIDLGDLSADEFAGMLGCSRTAYEMYENGLADPPAAVLCAFRERTGVSLDWLLTGKV